MGAVEGRDGVEPGERAAPDRVREMFDRISPSYDRMNRVMSLGMDGRWREAAARAARLEPGDPALDVCCGTGDLAIELRRAVGPGGRVVGLDFSEQMLEVARAKSAAVEWMQGDALGAAVRRRRVRRGHGRLGRPQPRRPRAGVPRDGARRPPRRRIVCLEMSQPPGWAAPSRTSGPTAPCPCWARCWRATATPTRTCRSPPARSRGAPQLAAIMRDAGLTTVGYRRLMLGVVAIHVGEVPR